LIILPKGVFLDIKAILLDFDGTALQRDQVFISCRNMYAIRQAIAKGIEIIPCTGRCEDMFPPQIEAEKRIRYWITASGARIVDRNEKKVLYQCVFSPEESAQLCEIFENQDIYTEISAEGHIYLEKKINDHLERFPVPSHHVWFVESGRQIPVEQPSKYFLEHQIGIEKCNLYGIPDEKQQEISSALNSTGLIAPPANAEKDIQFFPRRLDKIQAIEFLLKKLGLEFENVMSFGDSSMDADIIEKAGFGIAMGNSPDWIKAKAKYITKPYFEDGVAEAIEKFILC